MNRVRGINIVWLSLIAVLLGSMAVNVGFSSAKTKLYLDPARIPGPSGYGAIGESYVVSVYVDQVTDLWAAGFKIQYAPYVSVLTISEIYEGPFLATGWDPYPNSPTDFSYTVDLFKGFAYIAIVRLPNPDPEVPRMGASGSGLLATFKLTTIESGECPIDITEDLLLDSNGSPIDHNTIGSIYEGLSGSLVRVEVVPGKTVSVGEYTVFMTKVRNDGDRPLYIRTRFDISRLEDGRKIVLYSGDTYLDGGFGEDPPSWTDYLYVNDFTNTYGAAYGWNYEGTGPYLDAVGDGNFIWTDGADIPNYPAGFPITGKYDFADFALDPERVISRVDIEAYTKYAAGADENNDLDTYMRFPDVAPYPPTTWVGSLWGTGVWAWHTVRWTTDPVSVYYPSTLTNAGLNNARVRYIMDWTADDLPHGRVDIDAMRLKVTTIPLEWGVLAGDPEYLVVPPGGTVDLPMVSWTPKASHVGTYNVVATVEYTETFLKWNSWGSAQKTFKFNVVP
jgi:hypothetical protein